MAPSECPVSSAMSRTFLPSDNQTTGSLGTPGDVGAVQFFEPHVQKRVLIAYVDSASSPVSARAVVKKWCFLYNIARHLALPELVGDYPEVQFLAQLWHSVSPCYMNW